MKVVVVISLCMVLLSASVAAVGGTTPTISVYTEPTELEIWVDGERVGVGEAVILGPFDDYVEVTAKGKGYKDTAKVIRSPRSSDGNLVIVITGEKKRGFSKGSLVIGLGVSLAMFCLIFAGDL
jgi:hypothetical protein